MNYENSKKGLILLKEMEIILSALYEVPIKLAVIFTGQVITIELIKSLVSTGFGLEWRVILQTNRRDKIIFARMSFCYLAKRYTVASDREIAEIINRDRTTVLANRRTIGNLYKIEYHTVYPFLNPIINHLNSIENATKKVQN